MVCVPTPIDEHQVPNLSILAGASAMVVEHAVKGQLILMTSTTYAGCTRDMISEPLLARGLVPGVDVQVAFSPERINRGCGLHHRGHPARGWRRVGNLP